MPYELTSGDWDLRYRDSWIGRMLPNEEIQPIKVVDLGRSRFKGVSPGKDNWREVTFEYKDPFLILKAPPLGSINLSSGLVLYISPLLIKQYKDGLMEGNIIVFDPLLKVRNHLLEKKVEIFNYEGLDNMSLIIDLFNNKFFSPEQALSLVENADRLAAAFNRNWYFCIQYDSNKTFLYYKEQKVGFVKDKEIFLLKETDFLLEELQYFGLRVEVAP